MREEAPMTIRPSHPLLRALDSGEFLDYMEEVLVPAEWAVPTETGFWWIPHRLRHDIEIVEAGGRESARTTACRSTFLLCTDIEDEQNALGMCDYLNQRALGGAAWFHHLDRSIRFTSSVHLDPANWFAAFVFAETIPRLVGQLEGLAPRLADLVSGTAADISHPRLGRRTTPDQFLADDVLATLQPEAACGLWWSRREIEAFRRALRFQIQNAGQPDVADQIDPTGYDNDSTSANNIAAEVMWQAERSDVWTSCTVAEGRHPEYGFGIEFVLGTSLIFGEDHGTAGAPRSHRLSILAANSLNAHQHVTCAARLATGAWMTWRGQLVHETFLYPELVASLQYLAGEHAGEAMAMLAGQSTDHFRTLWEWRDAVGGDLGDPTHTHEMRWAGVGDNASHFAILGPTDELFHDLSSTYPINELIEPVDLGQHGFRLPTETTFATMGIFNPGGPTVGSIEVAINYQLGVALLLERSRHFLHPATRVHAVFDRDGFGRIDELLEDLVARLEWSTFDWWDTREATAPEIAAMQRGLRRFAEAHPEVDYRRTALALIDTRADPWERLDQHFEPRIDVPADVDSINLWIDAICDVANIDNHCAFIRSAWEGATTWFTMSRSGRDDAWLVAQRAADSARYAVWTRRGREVGREAG